MDISTALVAPIPIRGKDPDHIGKVVWSYYLNDEFMLVVYSDRVSALDVRLERGVPRKGEILAQLTAFWCTKIQLELDIRTHFVALIDRGNCKLLLGFDLPPEYLGRTLLVRRAKRLDAECIARGYLTGSGLADYQATGRVCGIQLPPGLVESSRLDPPIFTPSTKVEEHDRNIDYAELISIVGEEAASIMKRRTLSIFDWASAYALERGLIIADTKVEFGWWQVPDGDLMVILIDEVLTSDNSRFWLAASYREGGVQPSFDKDPIRRWFRSTGWKFGMAIPRIPDHVILETMERYLTVYRLLTGTELAA